MRIFLRPITEKDTASIVRWRNSDKVRSHCMTKAPITEDSHLNFYKEKILTGKYKQYIVERIEEETGLASYPIATVYLKDIDMENKRCELCIFTSSDVEWTSEGQSIAISMLINKAFNEFSIHKLYSYVFKKFPEEVDLLRDAGFNIEATLKGEVINTNGDAEDVIRLCIINK
jgi:RimJ/RimL family protein N-acetyltransferase